MIKDIFYLKEDFYTRDQSYVPSGTLFYKEKNDLFVSLGDDVKIMWLDPSLLEFKEKIELQKDVVVEKILKSVIF